MMIDLEKDMAGVERGRSATISHFPLGDMD